MCIFICVRLCVTVNKKQCFSIEPLGEKPCQHSQPQLKKPAPMLHHDPALRKEQASYSAFLSYPFQGKLLLSCISPHKPLNTSASTVNRLQQSKGTVYNYSGFLLQLSLQSLIQSPIKKRCCVCVCFTLNSGLFYNWKPGWYGVGFYKHLCVCDPEWMCYFCSITTLGSCHSTHGKYAAVYNFHLCHWKPMMKNICFFNMNPRMRLSAPSTFVESVQQSQMLGQRQSAVLQLIAAPASGEHCSVLALCYINTCGWDENSGSSVQMLLDY